MVDFIQKRFDFGYSNEDAVEKFWIWMRAGKFVDQRVFDDCEPYVDSLHLSFCELTVDFQADWNANVAMLNQSEWDRDFDAYNTSTEKRNSHGKQGPQPRQPDKSDYYEWTTASDSYEVEERLIAHTFTKEHVSGDRAIFEAAKSMSIYFWKKIRSAKTVDDNYVSDATAQEIGPLLEKQGAANFDKFLKKLLKQKYEKSSAVGYESASKTKALTSLYCPAYIINYRYNNEVYYCIMDGLTGESIAGRRPQYRGKMLKYGGIAAGALATVLLCVLAFNWLIGSHITPDSDIKIAQKQGDGVNNGSVSNQLPSDPDQILSAADADAAAANAAETAIAEVEASAIGSPNELTENLILALRPQLLPIKKSDFPDPDLMDVCNFVVDDQLLMIVADYPTTRGGIRMRGFDTNPNSTGDPTYIEMEDGRSFNSEQNSTFYYYARGTGISAYWTFRFRALTTKWKTDDDAWATVPAKATITYYESENGKGQVMDVINGIIGCNVAE